MLQPANLYPRLVHRLLLPATESIHLRFRNRIVGASRATTKSISAKEGVRPSPALGLEEVMPIC